MCTEWNEWEPIEEGQKGRGTCFSLHSKVCVLLFKSPKDHRSHRTRYCASLASPLCEELFIFNTFKVLELKFWKNCSLCCVHPPALLIRMHTYTQSTHTHTHTHTEAGISSPALLCEAAWQTPACKIKTYHQLSFSPRRPGDFMWGFTNLVRYLFISSVIKGLGSVMPLVRTTILWNPLSDGF